MKIKTKLILSFGLLLVLVITLSAVGGKYIYTLKEDSANILTNNYMSLEYVNEILFAIDQPDTVNAILIFEKNLKKQEHNITEVGESELTKELRNSFELFKQNQSDQPLKIKLRNTLLEITALNMSAIKHKNEKAKTTANGAYIWISITSILCVLIAFTVFFNLPADIANPIKELTESIKQIADRNYSKRLIFDHKNEFGNLANSFNIMAEKLEEYNNSNLSQLMFEKKRIETLINNMSDPVLVLDENDKVVFINPCALQILNMNESDCIDYSIHDLSKHNDLIRALIQDLNFTQYDETTKHEALKIYVDNKEKYFEKEFLKISIVPTGEVIARFVGHVILLRNVTEYKEIDFAKTNFIAIVSHELKTPISSIKMSIQLMENKQIGDLNDDQSQLLLSIKEDANRLLKITGELLSITQIESGNIQLSITPVEVNEILTYAINTIKTQAEQKKIRIVVECPNSIPKILADSEKTAWVLTNLISNAVRYSYENSTIQVSVYEQRGKINISVKDTGMGIAPEHKEKIFIRYFRVPGTKSEGNGLGLSISKEFIEAQGGEIDVVSEIGMGSIFTIKLNSYIV